MFAITASRRVLVNCAAALALLATSSVVHAQAGPYATACSDDVRQSLARIGGWADSQCTIQTAAAFVPVVANQKCSSEVRQALARIGAWAEAQCDA